MSESHGGVYSEVYGAGWKAGIDAFNRGQYWHAHEGWEQGWTRLPSPLREHVQSRIQGASVFYLLEKGRLAPARSLARRSLELAALAQSRAVELDPRIDVPGLEPLLAEIERGLAAGAPSVAAWLEKASTLRAALAAKGDDRA